MKRFTETEKWKDPWFRSLKPPHKLLFLYVVDNCNNAGFYEVDEEMIAFQTGLSAEHLKGAWKGLERGIKGASGWVWVRRFLAHQKNEELNPSNPAHKQIIGLIREQLERFSIVPEFAEIAGACKGLVCPIGPVKVKDKTGNPTTEWFPETLRDDEFRAKWTEFEEHTSSLGKPLSHRQRQSLLVQCEREGRERALWVIAHSIQNGARGRLYLDAPPNGKNGNHPSSKIKSASDAYGE